MLHKYVSLLLRLSLSLTMLIIVVAITILVGAAWLQRSGPDLKPWHRVNLESGFRAAMANNVQSLEDYLQLENQVFDELQRKLIDRTARQSAGELNRFLPGSPSYPDQNGENFNRTRVYAPDQKRGAVLMLHGMTDSPYSLRTLAEKFSANGFYVLNMRMPGHGTAPSELARVEWRDWMAAVRLGARHVRSQIDPDQPFWILGYSNGAALGLKYTLDQLEHDLPTPDRLVLISPMIGVSPLAGITQFFYWLGKLNYFEKSLWLDIYPEYDPHKYNSFPTNAGMQSRKMTLAITAQLQRLASSGQLAGIPPILAFQSLVDSTVDTRAVSRDLFTRLPENGSELVLFDINRNVAIESLVNPEANLLLDDMLDSKQNNYDLTVISNHSTRAPQVRAYHKAAATHHIREQELALAWPKRIFSLSHVALPFKPDDPIYGYLEPAEASNFPYIGRAHGIGENGALAVPASLFTRLRSNPFYEYLEQRIVKTLNDP